jgi:cyanophycin synthetase
VKEDLFRRGREAGDIAELIIDGLRDGGLSEHQYETIFDEQDAIARAMEKMKDNDLVVILADDVSGILDMVRRHSADGLR